MTYELDPLAHFDRLNEAEAALERAVADVPSDPGAWANLAETHQRKYGRTPNLEQRRDHLDAAEACARRSLAIDPDEGAAQGALVVAQAARLFQTEVPDAAQARALEIELDRLEEVMPWSPVLAPVRSDLLAMEGRAALDAGDEDRAYELFTQSAALHPLQLRARVMLGQINWMRGDFGSSLARIREAEDIWEKRAALAADDPPGMRFPIYVWGLGAADKLGELDLAFHYAEKAREFLDSGEGVVVPDAFSLAEFLAVPKHDELRDCALVRELLDRYPIEETFGATEADVLRAINGACPRD